MSSHEPKELVHGLVEAVELKDWDFAIIQTALKLYAKEKRRLGDEAHAKYADNIRAKLKPAFVRLVKRTKREHRRLETLLTHEKELHQFGPETRDVEGRSCQL